MAKMRISGGSDDLAVDFTELGGPLAERDDLSRTHKGEVEGIEEQHDVLPLRRNKREIMTQKTGYA